MSLLMLLRIYEPAAEILFLAACIILFVGFALLLSFLRNELFGDNGPKP